jgi:hypothetical protein
VLRARWAELVPLEPLEYLEMTELQELLVLQVRLAPLALLDLEVILETQEPRDRVALLEMTAPQRTA